MHRFIDQLINFIIGLVVGILSLRLILKLFAANPAAGFVNWVYDTTEPLLQPFIAAFPTPTARGGFTLEFTTLFAILIYAFVGYLAQEFLSTFGKKKR